MPPPGLSPVPGLSGSSPEPPGVSGSSGSSPEPPGLSGSSGSSPEPGLSSPPPGLSSGSDGSVPGVSPPVSPEPGSDGLSVSPPEPGLSVSEPPPGLSVSPPVLPESPPGSSGAVTLPPPRRISFGRGIRHTCRERRKAQRHREHEHYRNESLFHFILLPA